jgi:hypothetical protein
VDAWIAFQDSKDQATTVITDKAIAKIQGSEPIIALQCVTDGFKQLRIDRKGSKV